MKKFLILVALVICGCDSKADKLTKEEMSVFLNWNNQFCLCLMAMQPNLVAAISKDNRNNLFAFCQHSAEICLDSKSNERVKAEVKIMRSVGIPQCSEAYANKLFSKLEKEGISLACEVSWQPQNIVFISRLASLTTLCDMFYGSDIDCICAARLYVDALSDEEYKIMHKTGNIFPDHNKKIVTPAEIAKGTGTMGKFKNAISKCKM